MQWFYDPGYDYGGGLPGSPREVHGFILHKPSEIRDQLVREGIVAASAFRKPEPVTERELTRVHEASVIAGLRDVQAVARAIELSEAALLPLVALPTGGYSDKSPSITAAGFRAIAEIERDR